MKAKPVCKKYPGTKEWHLNGNLHREDGPAVEWSGGAKMWYINDIRHREDGPAIEYADGTKSWYLNGIKFTEESYWKELYNSGKITEKELFLKLL
jgi:hypothetical protein